MIPIDFDRTAMERFKPEVIAKLRDGVFGFMIARDNVQLAGSFAHDFAGGVEAFGPIHQVPGGYVVIGLGAIRRARDFKSL